jgi:hypothetical protein
VWDKLFAYFVVITQSRGLQCHRNYQSTAASLPQKNHAQSAVLPVFCGVTDVWAPERLDRLPHFALIPFSPLVDYSTFIRLRSSKSLPRGYSFVN